MERYRSYSDNLAPCKLYTMPLHQLLASREVLMSVGLMHRPAKPTQNSTAEEEEDLSPFTNVTIRMAAIERLKKQILEVLGRCDPSEANSCGGASADREEQRGAHDERQSAATTPCVDYLNCLDHGESPLYVACLFHSAEVILFLLSLGADPTLCVNGRADYDAMTKAPLPPPTPAPPRPVSASDSPVAGKDDENGDDEDAAGYDELGSIALSPNSELSPAEVQRLFFVAATLPSNDRCAAYVMNAMRGAADYRHDANCKELQPNARLLKIFSDFSHFKSADNDDIASFLFCEREYCAGRDLFSRMIAKRYYDNIGGAFPFNVHSEEEIKKMRSDFKPPSHSCGEHGDGQFSGWSSDTFGTRFCYRLLPLQCALERGYGGRPSSGEYRQFRYFSTETAITLIDAFVSAGARFSPNGRYDINAVDGFGFTALSVVCRRHCNATTRVAEHLLLRHGAHAMHPPPRTHLLIPTENASIDTAVSRVEPSSPPSPSPRLILRRDINTLPKAFADLFPRNAKGYFLQGPDFGNSKSRGGGPFQSTGPAVDILEGYDASPPSSALADSAAPEAAGGRNVESSAPFLSLVRVDACSAQRVDIPYRCASPFYSVSHSLNSAGYNSPLIDAIHCQPFSEGVEDDLPPTDVVEGGNGGEEAPAASCRQGHPPAPPTVASLAQSSSIHPYYSDYFVHLPSTKKALESHKHYRPCLVERAVINCIGLFVLCGADVKQRTGDSLPHRNIFDELTVVESSPFLFHSLVDHFGIDPFEKVFDEFGGADGYSGSIKLSMPSLVDGSLPTAADSPEALGSLCCGRAVRWRTSVQTRSVPLLLWDEYWEPKLSRFGGHARHDPFHWEMARIERWRAKLKKEKKARAVIPYSMAHILTNEEAFCWYLDVYFNTVRTRCNAILKAVKKEKKRAANGGGGKNKSEPHLVIPQDEARRYFFTCADVILGAMLIDRYGPEEVMYCLAKSKSLYAELFRSTIGSDAVASVDFFSPTSFGCGGFSPAVLLLTRRFGGRHGPSQRDWQAVMGCWDIPRQVSGDPKVHIAEAVAYGRDKLPESVKNQCVREMIYDLLLFSSPSSLLAPRCATGGYPAIFYIPLTRYCNGYQDSTARRNDPNSLDCYHRRLFGSDAFVRASEGDAALSYPSATRRTLRLLVAQGSADRSIYVSSAANDTRQDPIALLAFHDTCALLLACGAGGPSFSTALALAAVKFLIREWHLACTFRRERDHQYYERFLLLRRSIVEMIAACVETYGADVDALYALLLHHYPEEGLGASRFAAVETAGYDLLGRKASGTELALSAQFDKFYDTDVDTLLSSGGPAAVAAETSYWDAKDCNLYSCGLLDPPAGDGDEADESDSGLSTQEKEERLRLRAGCKWFDAIAETGRAPPKAYAFHMCGRDGSFRPMVSARGGIVDAPAVDAVGGVAGQKCATRSVPFDSAAAALNFLTQTALEKEKVGDYGDDGTLSAKGEVNPLSLAERRAIAVATRKSIAAKFGGGGDGAAHASLIAKLNPSFTATPLSSAVEGGADSTTAAYYRAAGPALVAAEATAADGDFAEKNAREMRRREMGIPSKERISMTSNPLQDLWAVLGEQTLLFYMLHARGGAPRHRRALPDEYVALVKNGVWASVPPPPSDL